MSVTLSVEHFHTGKGFLDDSLKRRSSMVHTPVMVDETLRHLLHEDSRRILDCTLGGGGHARAILQANSNVSLIGIDRDVRALADARRVLAEYESRVRIVEGSYVDAGRAIGDSAGVDGILVDLGVSSLQLDESSRGFSYSHDGPLDMRMGPDGPTAKSLIESTSVEELTRILKVYGEVRGAARIAKSIRRAAAGGDISTTFDLKGAVDAALIGRPSRALLSKVFQAIRIALNEELKNLETFLNGALDHLRPNGRLVIISYHSLEDRMVKGFLKRESTDCLCPPAVPRCVCQHRARLEVLTRRVLRPSAAEVADNPRSRSAGLRAARVLEREQGV